MNCSTWGLLQGAVDGVYIRGLGWTSPLGLSARLLEVTYAINACSTPFDMSAAKGWCKPQRLSLAGNRHAGPISWPNFVQARRCNNGCR